MLLKYGVTSDILFDVLGCGFFGRHYVTFHRFFVMGTHRFFHVDRYKQLAEGTVIQLDKRQLSLFGSIYWDAITKKSFTEMTDAEQREFLLERVKREPRFAEYVSRMQAFFGSNTLEEAKRFYEKVEPKQPHPVPIYEVFASRYWSFDMTWLDYSCSPEQRVNYIREYWYATLTNHAPEYGERRPPLIEVLMELPVEIGKVVEWV